MEAKQRFASRFSRGVLAGILAVGFMPAAAFGVGSQADAGDGSPSDGANPGSGKAPAIIEQLAAQQLDMWQNVHATNNLNFLYGTQSYSAEDAGIATASTLSLADSTYLPAQFDLRDQGVVTPVKQQSPWGTCWGFAAVAAAETSILSETGYKYGTDENAADEWALDLSERQLAWFSQTALPDDPDDPQAGEGSYSVAAESGDSNQRLNTGGMPFTATSIFSTGIGPTYEAGVPYRNNESIEATPRTELNDEQLEAYVQAGGNPDEKLGYYSSTGDWSVPESERFAQVLELEESNMLPNPCVVDSIDNPDGGPQDPFIQKYSYNEAGTIAIKEQLAAGRAVQMAFHADTSRPGQEGGSKYINVDGDTWAHYTYEPMTANHAVTIVGWDDNYKASNFLEGHQPQDEDGTPLNGAWIVKNSWGAGTEEFPNGGDWGVKDDGGTSTGYFYLSYYDQSLSSPESLDFYTDNLDEPRNAYYVNAYDYMPSNGVMATTGPTKVLMANVFTAEGDQMVRSVSTETSMPSTSVTYKLYLLNEGATEPDDGTLMDTQQATYEYGGYHRTDLETPFAVREGQRFSVVVEQRTASGKYQMLTDSALTKEGLDAVKAWGLNLGTYSKGVVNKGESFFWSQDSADAEGKWTDWADGIQMTRDALTNDWKEQGGQEATGITDPGLWNDYDNFALKAYADPIELPDPEPSDQVVAVPNLTGMTEADALAALQDVGLTGQKGNDVFSDTIAAGLVAAQNVAAETEVKVGTAVVFQLSKGAEPKQESVPPVTTTDTENDGSNGPNLQAKTPLGGKSLARTGDDGMTTAWAVGAVAVAAAAGATAAGVAYRRARRER